MARQTANRLEPGPSLTRRQPCSPPGAPQRTAAPTGTVAPPASPRQRPQPADRPPEARGPFELLAQTQRLGRCTQQLPGARHRPLRQPSPPTSPAERPPPASPTSAAALAGPCPLWLVPPRPPTAHSGTAREAVSNLARPTRARRGSEPQPDAEPRNADGSPSLPLTRSRRTSRRPPPRTGNRNARSERKTNPARPTNPNPQQPSSSRVVYRIRDVGPVAEMPHSKRSASRDPGRRNGDQAKPDRYRDQIAEQGGSCGYRQQDE